MKGIFTKILLVLLILVKGQSYAQYSIKQIDSIYLMAFDSINPGEKSGSADLVYNASKAINYQKGMVEGLILYSKSSYASERYDKAFEYIIQAQNAVTKINDPFWFPALLHLKAYAISGWDFTKKQIKL